MKRRLRAIFVRAPSFMSMLLGVTPAFASISLASKSAIGAQGGDFTAEVFGRELPADAETMALLICLSSACRFDRQ